MHVLLLIAMSLAAAPDMAQRRPMGTGAPERSVSATIDLKVGAAAYSFSGKARCEHMPKGSIYDVVAERWSVNQSGNGQNLMLNVWKPLAGGENLITLSVTTAGKSQTVNTSAPSKQGSGTVTFAPQGTGGTFTINATSDSGAKISGTVKCEAFTPAEAVAG
jgi:hypothetical protein